jgi:hypothetical protein
MNTHFKQRATVLLRLAAVISTTFLVACGGGGSSTSGITSSGFFAVTAAKNGSAYTACVDNAVFVDPKSIKGLAVTADILAYYGLTGANTTLAGTGEGCRSKFPLANTTISVSYFNDLVSGAASKATTSTGAGTTTASTNTGGTATWTTWSGSANGTVIKDKNNNNFSVRVSDRAVAYLIGTSNNYTLLSGLTVDNSALVKYNGVTIGGVDSVTSTSGTQIASFYCLDATLMGITVGVGTSWTYSCPSSSSGTTSTGSGSATGSGASSTAVSYINWTNSVNGTYVVDASGDNFQFNVSTRCIYSLNTGKEYTNYCLGSAYTGVFAGVPFNVYAVKSTTNQCIAALVDNSGYLIDIYTSGSTEIAKTTTTLAITAGC